MVVVNPRAPLEMEESVVATVITRIVCLVERCMVEIEYEAVVIVVFVGTINNSVDHDGQHYRTYCPHVRRCSA